MLTRQRKQLILKKLKKDGQIVAKDVSHQLGLSEDTIRRDLRELAQEGLLQRVHGGALPASPAVVNFAGREQLASGAKIAIGRAAADQNDFDARMLHEFHRDGWAVGYDGRAQIVAEMTG